MNDSRMGLREYIMACLGDMPSGWFEELAAGTIEAGRKVTAELAAHLEADEYISDRLVTKQREVRLLDGEEVLGVTTRDETTGLSSWAEVGSEGAEGLLRDAVDALRAIEWGTEGMCPECWGGEPPVAERHTNECRVGRVLRGVV